jgi:hypothetical protein
MTGQLRTKSQRRRTALARSHEAGRTIHARNDLLPKLQLLDRGIDELVPPARNARPADPAHVREIASAIATLGFCVPVLIDQDDRVIDGWARVEAARGRWACGASRASWQAISRRPSGAF